MTMFQDKAGLPYEIGPFFALAADDEIAEGGGGGCESEKTDDAAPEVESVEEKAEETAKPQADSESGQTEPAFDEFAAAMANDDAFRPMGGPGYKKSAAGQVDYSGSYQPIQEGAVVKGTVVHIDREGVLVDVGMKSEGIIRLPELTRDSFQNPEDVVKVGEEIDVFVLQTENQDGNLMLSKKRADFEVAWRRVEEAHATGKVISALVSDRVKGGLVVDLGIRGFVPASHVGSGKVKNLDKYIGQSLSLKVIEVDRDRRKVVLSHRLAVEEERDRQREETLGSLAENQVRQGVVRRITDYGAFVDLGGIDGLLHISEISWTRIKHPSEVLKVGQKVQVIVLKMNNESGRVSLGMRQILPDPWQGVADRYRVGDIIRGKVSRLVPFGAFVLLEEGIEGIIPNQELAYRRVNKPEQVVSVGQEVEIKVLDVRAEERKMTLSLKALQEREMPQEPVVVQQPTPSREAPRTTVADLLGESFAEQRALLEREMGGKAQSSKRKKAKAKAQERAEAEAFGDLSDEELLDLAVIEPVDEDVPSDEAYDVTEAEESGKAVDESAADAPEEELKE